MRRFLSLISNELLKISKKTAVIVLICIMVVGMVGCSVFLKGVTEVVVYIEDIVKPTDTYYNENNERIAEIETELEGLDEGSKDYILLYDELLVLKEENSYYEVYVNLADKYDVNNFSYKKDILDSIYSMYNSIIQQEYSSLYNPQADYNESIAELNTNIESYMNLLETGSYEKYLEYEKELILNDENYSEVEKTRRIEYLDLTLKICPTGQYGSQEEKQIAEKLIYAKAELEHTLKTGIDYEAGTNLTEEDRERVEKDLDIINKKIECSVLEGSTVDSDAGVGFTTAFSVGNLFAVIVLIILAGSMISHEISTGTIKSLIIAPVKRWKIFLAKYVTLIIMVIGLSMLTYLISVLINGLLYGFGSYGTEVYYFAGNVVQMNYAVAMLIYTMCEMIPMIFLATMAFMLSSITKSTAASVAITMGVYWGGEILQLILTGILYSYSYVLDFLPFGNLQWFNKIFYSGESVEVGVNSLIGATTTGLGETSATFAIIYTLVLIACMYLIGRDSFCKRDIKQ